MRSLTIQELDVVSGGYDETGDIVVTGYRSQGLSDFDRMLLENALRQESYMDDDRWSDGGGGGVAGTIEDFLEDREAVFKATVKALIPGDPITKEIVAEAVTQVRNFLITLTSLETKAALSNWFDRNVEKVANLVFSDYNNQTGGVSNPVDFFRGLFGQPGDPAPFDPD